MGTAVLVASAYIFAGGWLSAPPNDLSNVLDVGSMLAGCLAVIYVLGTIRVVGGAEGYVEMVNLLVLRRVPVEEIGRVVVTTGLRLVLKSGREIGSSAYGQSLAGQMSGYPRSVQAAHRVEAFLWSLPATSWRPPGQRPVETRVRVRDLAVGLGLGVVLLLGTVVLNAVRTG